MDNCSTLTSTGGLLIAWLTAGKLLLQIRESTSQHNESEPGKWPTIKSYNKQYERAMFSNTERLMMSQTTIDMTNDNNSIIDDITRSCESCESLCKVQFSACHAESNWLIMILLMVAGWWWPLSWWVGKEWFTVGLIDHLSPLVTVLTNDNW